MTSKFTFGLNDPPHLEGEGGDVEEGRGEAGHDGGGEEGAAETRRDQRHPSQPRLQVDHIIFFTSVGHITWMCNFHVRLLVG